MDRNRDLAVNTLGLDKVANKDLLADRLVQEEVKVHAEVQV